MNCSLCGLPQDTGALGSVLPQCICHWKHTPYRGTPQTELNAGGESVKNATYWKRQYNHLLMKLNTSALKIAELEKLLEQSIGSDCREMRYIQEIENKDAQIAKLEKGIPEGMIDPKSYYIGYENGKKAPQTKPLSDEEIWEWFEKNTALTKESALRIGRAIEAKVRGER